MSILNIGPAAIPSLGLGTFKMKEGEAREITKAALAEGYRHIDTAQAYENEIEVGEGIRASATPRDQIFLTTKILPRDFAAADFRKAAEASLKALGTDYVDLLLLHWPSKEVALSETLPVLDQLIDEGKVRFGGVSNFTIPMLEQARDILQAPLAANQVEMHPFIDQTRLRAFMQQADIPLQAYAPLAQGRVMENAVMAEIAETHQTSAAAIAVAWLLHKPGVIALPKTAKPSRLAGNLAAAEIALSPDQIARIDALVRPDGRIVAPEGLAPDWDD
ncbi:aldo/keto reductase [Paracoccus homiensis]|uniref:Aldo/keto reductase n=1 Tax=Paracoccus homiensis TaxID=364199 RepID=A0A1I0DL58_9RHOB|nr:aldo/keto reductase [Paracoccus homiensis]SET33214.1 Aldo/keto reductase [Paracoccus homiensis]